MSNREDGQETEWRPRKECYELLRTLSKYYNLFLFTDGLKVKVEPLVEIIDPFGNIISETFYRENCVKVDTLENTLYFKDLNTFKGIDLEQTLLIDSSILSFAFQLGNGVPVLPWFGKDVDCELSCLREFLLDIKDSNLRSSVHEKLKLVSCYQKLNKERYFEEQFQQLDKLIDSSVDSMF